MRTVKAVWRACAISCLLAAWNGGSLLAGEGADATNHHADSLLVSVDHSPMAARWVFGPVDAAGRMPFRVEWGGCSTQNVSPGVLLKAPGQAMTQKAGEPTLPLVATLLPGIGRGMPRVESLVMDDWMVYTNILVAPVGRMEASYPDEGPVWHPVLRADPRIYGSDEFWPGTMVDVQDFWRGTQRLVRVECRLLCYNPVQKILKVARRMEGVLAFDVGP